MQSPSTAATRPTKLCTSANFIAPVLPRGVTQIFYTPSPPLAETTFDQRLVVRNGRSPSMGGAVLDSGCDHCGSCRTTIRQRR